MKDLIGKRYGRLIVIKKTGKKAHGKENVYLCKCDCGNTVEVRSGAFDGRFNKNNTSGFKGVSKHHGGYRAKITVKGHTYYGKTRSTKEEAYKDRLKFEEELLPKRKGK